MGRVPQSKGSTVSERTPAIMIQPPQHAAISTGVSNSDGKHEVPSDELTEMPTISLDRCCF